MKARNKSYNAIFTIRQMQKNYGNKGEKLYFAFVDPENAFDRCLGT